MSRSQKRLGWIGVIGGGGLVTALIYFVNTIFAAGTVRATMATKDELATTATAITTHVANTYVTKAQFGEVKEAVTRMDEKVDRILERLPKPHYREVGQ